LSSRFGENLQTRLDLSGIGVYAVGMRPTWLRFPTTVNEKAARVVAAGVVAQALVFVVTGWTAVLAIMALGFLTRVIAGPTLSVLGRFAVHVAAPRLGTPRIVAGSPKRFAQGIGLVVSTTALVAAIAGASTVALAAAGMLVVAAGLEAGLGFCLGCWMYGQLVRLGVLPETACVECTDISLRRRPPATVTAA
jgi:Domain of unknown function (DUF4395)